MMKVLITGATGLLGGSLVTSLADAGYRILRHGYSKTADFNGDLTDPVASARLLTEADPDMVVNLAALTQVDACEADPQRAYLLNVRTVQNLCGWIRSSQPQCHLLQLSTDQVYDGNGPHDEESCTLRNYYAFSKFAAELAAASVGATILRTNFFGRSCVSGRHSFTDWLHQALVAGTPIKVFSDVLFSPLSLRTLCAMIILLLRSRPQGVFNLGSREGMSKADFAFAFAASLGVSAAPLQRALSSESLRLTARRPLDMRMDCRRVEANLGLVMPRLLDELALVRGDYHEKA